MAGDWIKMRSNLWDDPRVSRLCDLTKASEAEIVGGLYWLWTAADQHATGNLLPGLSFSQIDRKTGIKGFGKSLQVIGWAEETDEGVKLPRFEEHNGETAKRRAEAQKRKANWRSRNVAQSTYAQDTCPASDGTQVTQASQDCHAESAAREEKRREVLDTPSQEDRGEILTARAHALPPHWAPGQHLLEWAWTERPDLKGDALLKATQDFRDHYASKGERRADWDAAWRKWVRGQRAPHQHQPAAIQQGPAAAAHSVDRAREVIQETREAARTAVAMPESIRALIQRRPAPQDPEQVP